MNDKFCCQQIIPHYFLIKDVDYISRLIKHQKLEIFHNLLDILADEQHYTIRFKTYRDNDYDFGRPSIRIRTMLDLSQVEYLKYKMPVFDGIDAYLRTGEQKLDWICVYCGTLQPYEIIKFKHGQKYTEKLLKCQNCNGSKLS